MASLLGTAISAATKAATQVAKNVSSTTKEKKDKKSSNSSLSGTTATGNEHANYINNNYEGGLNAYKSLQQNRYDSAIASGDNDLLQKLEADAQKVGYVLMPTASKSGTVNTPYSKYSNVMNMGDTPTLDLPDYKDFNYSDYKAPDEFSYKDFSYDPNKDASYKSYAEQYARQGQAASEKALANTAAATGGMASSYASAANAQAQQAYAKKTSDMIPLLEEAAYNKYNTDKNFDYTQYTNDKNFDYTSYLNDRNLSYQDYQNAYNSKVNNATLQNSNDWNTVNYQNALKQYQESQAAAEQARQDALSQQQIDNDYRNQLYDTNVAADTRDYSYKAQQDAIDNSYRNQALSYSQSQNNTSTSLAQQKFEYQKAQDELLFNYQKEQDKLKNSTSTAKTDSSAQLQAMTSAALNDAMTAKDAASWLRDNSVYLQQAGIYDDVYKVLKNNGSLK